VAIGIDGFLLRNKPILLAACRENSHALYNAAKQRGPSLLAVEAPSAKPVWVMGLYVWKPNLACLVFRRCNVELCLQRLNALLQIADVA
jgi:hypothetical protein